MPEGKRQTVYLHGKFYWVKVLGNPRPNYDGDAREWTFEFEPDEAGVEILKDNGLDDRLKDRSSKKGYEGRKPFIILRRKEFSGDGTANEKIRVVDAANQPWSEKTLIGNGTDGDVKVQIVDWGPRKKMGIYPLAMRVLELIPYQSNDFEPLEESDPRRQKAENSMAEFRRDFDLSEEDHPDEPVETPADPDDDLDDEVPV